MEIRGASRFPDFEPDRSLVENESAAPAAGPLARPFRIRRGNSNRLLPGARRWGVWRILKWARSS